MRVAALACCVLLAAVSVANGAIDESGPDRPTFLGLHPKKPTPPEKAILEKVKVTGLAPQAFVAEKSEAEALKIVSKDEYAQLVTYSEAVMEYKRLAAAYARKKDLLEKGDLL